MNQKSQNKRPNPANFLEAFRELGRDTISEAKIQVKKMVIEDVPQSLGISGTIAANESVSITEISQKAEVRGEKKAEARFSQRLAQMREEEHSFYLHLETQNKQQINSILSEIKLLAKSTGALAHEIESAASLAPAHPGIYHRNFFDQLLSFMKVLRQKVQDSQHWLATVNSRASKKGHYWGQVGQSGSKFMLSSERYMVTSTG